jgi:hypothetical protein
MRKLALIFLAALILSSCTDYGKKLEYGKGELYYTDKVSEAEAKNLGKYLSDVKMFPEGKEVSYQIDKDGETYVFKLVVNDEKYTTDQAYIDDSQMMAGFISHDVFGDKPVQFWLCDDSFEPLKKLGFTALPDSIKKQSDMEKLINPTNPTGEPKDEVIPVDTSQGQPA